jgi:hypothetical protein
MKQLSPKCEQAHFSLGKLDLDSPTFNIKLQVNKPGISE